MQMSKLLQMGQPAMCSAEVGVLVPGFQKPVTELNQTYLKLKKNNFRHHNFKYNKPATWAYCICRL